MVCKQSGERQSVLKMRCACLQAAEGRSVVVADLNTGRNGDQAGSLDMDLSAARILLLGKQAARVSVQQSVLWLEHADAPAGIMEELPAGLVVLVLVAAGVAVREHLELCKFGVVWKMLFKSNGTITHAHDSVQSC